MSGGIPRLLTLNSTRISKNKSSYFILSTSNTSRKYIITVQQTICENMSLMELIKIKQMQLHDFSLHIMIT